MNRTYIVSTLVSINQLNTSYINLDPSSRYASSTTVVLHERPFRPVGMLPAQVPETVGQTVVIEHFHGENG